MPLHQLGLVIDFILIGALLIQAALLWSKVETFAEAAVLAVFHALGLALEVVNSF